MPKDPRLAIPPSDPLAVCSTDLSRPHYPGWAILYSFVLHAVAFTGLMFIPVDHSRPEEEPFLAGLWAARGTGGDTGMIVYLPSIGGGGQGGGGKPEPSSDEPPAAMASGEEGLIYPGPQPIRSDTPSPTSRSQTLLQPGREDLPILKTPMNLPNLVSLRDVGLALQPRQPDASERLPMPVPIRPKPQPPDEAEADSPQRDVEDLLVVKRPPQLPEPVSMADIELALQPGLDPFARLPELPKPEETKPAGLSDDPQAEPVKLGLEDSPDTKPPADLPKPSRSDAEQPQASLSQPPAPQPDVQPQREPPAPEDTPTEPVQSEPEDPPTERDLTPAEPLPPVKAPTPVVPSEALPEPHPLPKTELGNLLAVSPTPAWPDQPLKIPEAESRGRFTISPQPDLAASGPEPGAPGPAAPAEANSASPPSVVTISFGSGDSAQGTGASGGSGAGEAGRSGSGSGPGTGAGSGSGAGVGPGSGPFEGITVVGGIDGAEASRPGGSGSGSGSGAGPGPFDGITTVGGIGETGASGSGAGAAPGSQPFEGISTVGGIGATEASPNIATNSPDPPPVQTKYGVVVLSREDSGGGLPYLGVFSSERIHTVYLDMRDKATDTDPMWILEFAEPQRAAFQATPAEDDEESLQGFVKPAPTLKEKPKLPPDLVRKHSGEMIIVYAVINAEGKVEQMSVKESPDLLLNQPVLNALSKWEFRPGALNGEPVAVKALLGIPLGSPAR